MPQHGQRHALEWLTAVYRHACRRFPRRRGLRGRNWFPPARVVAVAILMRQRGLSTRGARELFVAVPALAEAIRLRHVPHASWFARVTKFAADNLGLLPPRKRRSARALPLV